MPAYILQQSIETVDNVSANYATNMWGFIADDATPLPTITTNIKQVYDTIRPHMSNLVRQNLHGYKWYAVSDPKPRAPILEGTWNLATAPTGAPLPTEVSLCLSFQGVKISGQNQARRRGRVYIPFLNTSASDSTARPAAATITALVTAGTALLAQSDAAATWSWVVFSSFDPTNGALIDNGWVDNEFDTQRRRGRLATQRTVYT